jgi:hypothetical protein
LANPILIERPFTVNAAMLDVPLTLALLEAQDAVAFDVNTEA